MLNVVVSGLLVLAAGEYIAALVVVMGARLSVFGTTLAVGGFGLVTESSATVMLVPAMANVAYILLVHILREQPLVALWKWLRGLRRCPQAA